MEDNKTVPRSPSQCWHRPVLGPWLGLMFRLRLSHEAAEWVRGGSGRGPGIRRTDSVEFTCSLGSHEALTGDRCGDRIPVPVFRWRHVFCVNLIQVTTASVFSFPCHDPRDWCHVAWHGAILPIRQSDKSQNGCATVIRRAFLARARV